MKYNRSEAMRSAQRSLDTAQRNLDQVPKEGDAKDLALMAIAHILLAIVIQLGMIVKALEEKES